MLFLLIFLYCYLCVLILISIGYVVNTKFLRLTEGKDYLENVLFGIIFISFLSLFLNFFTSLNQYINSLSLLFVIYFFTQLNFFQFKKVLGFSLIISLIAFITFILDNSNRPDAGLYHLPYISILNEHKIIFGSANLHWRFGNISILQYFSAIFNNLIFKDNGILMPIAMLYSSFVLFFLLNTFDKKNPNYLKIISFLFLTYILSAMNRYSGFGNDAPVHMFYFLTIFYFIKEQQNLNKTKIFNKILYISLFTFLIKSFFALMILFPLYLVVLNYKKISFLNRTSFFCTFFLFLWLLKNIIVSSCVIYPISFTCFDKLEWSTKNSKQITLESEAWAKDWPNRDDKSEDYEDYLSNNDWIKIWLKNHFKILTKKMSPQIIIIFIMMVVLMFGKNIKTNKLNRNYIFISMLLSLFFSFIWFLKFPLYRFGESFLISLISLTFVYLFYFKIIGKNKLAEKSIITLTIILCFIVFSKNMLRIKKGFSTKYVDYPWPKKNSFSFLNEKNNNFPIKKREVILYYKPYPNQLCHYSKSPCTHVGNLKVNRKKILNYYMFYKE